MSSFYFQEEDDDEDDEEAGDQDEEEEEEEEEEEDDVRGDAWCMRIGCPLVFCRWLLRALPDDLRHR